MGGPGSGPRPTSLKTQQGRNKLNGCVPYAWRVIKRTLAQAAEADQIPPASTLALAQWCLEQEIGKPTVKVDASVQSTLTLDPSRMLQALREARATEADWMLERQNGSQAMLPEQTMSDNTYCATSTPGGEDA